MHDSAAAVAELRSKLPGVEIITKPAELLTYYRDAGMDGGTPDAVAFPRTATEVAGIVCWAAKRGIPLIARGSGTGVSGGAVAEHGGVLVGFSRMTAVVLLDPAQRLAIVEPGVINLALNRRALTLGLCFPPDPSSGHVATIGGNVAENAGGPHCFKYGVTTNYVLGLETVLADGQCVRLGGAALDYPEYDLTGVVVGSEGTLGMVTAAYLRLLRQPAAFKTLLAAFDSLDAAGDAVSAIIAHGLTPAALEMVDQKMTRIIEAYAHAGLPVDAAACIVIEVDGHPDGLDAQMDEIVSILRQHGVSHLRVAQGAAERDAIWKARKSVGGAVARLAPAYYSLDTTVPRSCLAQTLRCLNAICEEAGLRVGYALHAGDGNLHPHLLIEDPKDAGLVAHVLDTGSRMMQACVELGGTITGEHGVGIEKRPFMALMYGPDEITAMRDVKAVFDPTNLLNPGKIFPEVRGRIEPPDGRPASPPVGEVISPRSADEAGDLLRACAEPVPPVPAWIRGAGTKARCWEAAAWGAAGALTLDTRALRGVRTLAPDDLYVVAGAGTPLAELEAQLAEVGMWAPLVSPWPEATLGGIISTNFNAPLRMRYGYGAIRDQVLALTVALPNGRVIRAGRPLVKNVAGYDLPKLLIGAHGTLGLIADVTLKLTPLPRSRASLICEVADFAEGSTWGERLIRICGVASALLLCRGHNAGLQDVPYALIYTAEGLPQDVRAELAEVRAALSGAKVREVQGMSGSELWADWIGAVLPEETLMRAGVAPCAVAKLAASAVDSASTSFMADLAAGLLYLRGQTLQISELQAAARAVEGYATVLRPSLTAPADLDRWGHLPQGLALMRALKARWDPAALLNRGCFLA